MSRSGYLYHAGEGVEHGYVNEDSGIETNRAMKREGERETEREREKERQSLRGYSGRVVVKGERQWMGLVGRSYRVGG